MVDGRNLALIAAARDLTLYTNVGFSLKERLLILLGFRLKIECEVSQDVAADRIVRKWTYRLER